MTPATHTTRLTELLEKQQSTRIHTGIEEHHGGAIRGLMFCLLFEVIAVAAALIVWYFWR